MKSVLTDMDANEREALKNGSRKRKAPVAEEISLPKNLQQKKVTGGGAPKATKDDDDEDEDFKAMRQMVAGRTQRGAAA
jgi:hypothetical protein